MIRGKGRGDIFTNPNTLDHMLKLRMQGVGPSELGRMFGVDHTTIIYHSKRNNVFTPVQKGVTVSGGYQIIPAPVVVKISISRCALGMVRYDDDGSRINPGMDYADYVMAAELKKDRWDLLTKKK